MRLVASGKALRFVMLIAPACLAITVAAPARAEIKPDYVMESSPPLVVPEPIVRVSNKYAPLWKESLARPEADLQRLTAEAITDGFAAGLPGMRDMIPALVKLASAETTHSAARQAAVRALMKFDAADSAPVLFEISKRHGADFRAVIEPVLARWKFAPIREIWQARIKSPDTRLRDLMLAIDGMAALGEASDVAGLLAIVHDSSRPQPVRLAAARAAGKLQSTGLEPDAAKLLQATPNTISRKLYALGLIDRHDSGDAQKILLGLAVDSEPAAAAAALKRLNAIDHNLVLPLAEKAMQNPDQHVRQQGINAYVALPTPPRVTFVARLLDDPHPEIRANVREDLFRLAAQPELSDPIRTTAMEVLAAESWRGQEQAALLLAALDHKPAAPRLVQLLEAPRGEVMVASAWGLRKLAVPETLPAILDKATRQTQFRLTGGVFSNYLDLQVAHLLETFGVMKYAPAEPLLRQYIPKDFKYGFESRAAAIWSLGLLHEGVPDEELAQLLTGRLTDPSTSPPEQDPVRTTSAISIGRMKAVSQVEPMKRYLGPKVIPLRSSLAMQWAIRELTGEQLPDPEPLITSRGNFFLEPLDSKSEDMVPVEN